MLLYFTNLQKMVVDPEDPDHHLLRKRHPSVSCLGVSVPERFWGSHYSTDFEAKSPN